MHITRVEIENVLPLGDVDIDCDERVNLFIGPNASGKSTILRAITASTRRYLIALTIESSLRTPALSDNHLEDKEIFTGYFLESKR